MGLKYGKGLYFGTRGSIVNTYFKVSTLKEARANIPLLPIIIQDSVKRFWNNGSNNYVSFSVSHDTSGNYIAIMEKPGEVTGSKAIYFKIIDSQGKSRVYKETYDPQGNLVHSKNK